MTLKDKYDNIKVKGVSFDIDPVLHANFQQLKKSVEAKWDCVFVIDGREGVAKSTLGKMCGYYLSNGKFSVDNIVFTSEQFMEAVDKAKPKTAIVFDEMVMAGLSTDVLSGMQKALTKKFTLIRKKQLYIILIIPYIFMLQKYFALSRALFLIHCYSPDGYKRGFFKFYNYEQKNFLYMVGHKYWHYNAKAQLSFTGKFPDYSNLFIDEEAYENKKDAAIKSISDKDKELKFTPKELESIVGIPANTVYEHHSPQNQRLRCAQKKIKEFNGLKVQPINYNIEANNKEVKIS